MLSNETFPSLEISTEKLTEYQFSFKKSGFLPSDSSDISNGPIYRLNHTSSPRETVRIIKAHIFGDDETVPPETV